MPIYTREYFTSPRSARPRCWRPPTAALLLLCIALTLWGCRRQAASPPGQKTAAPQRAPSATAAEAPQPKHGIPNTTTELARLDKLPAILVSIKGHPFKLWVARTDAQQHRGLMFIRSMPANRGMIFVFPYSQNETFWMKNTFIPLDLLFLDRSGRVRQFETMPAWDGTAHYYPSLDLVRYAIELNAGVARQLGLSVGYRILLPKAITTAP
ncbi:MAG: hypothetical protein HKL96_01615 [Phycisphaerales bacterium]|nr:hypothetical protein [Phycisphaerales bacterium]